jgi:hypothetical protein
MRYTECRRGTSSLRLTEGKGNWIGRILRGNCLLKHDIDENIEGMLEVTKDEEGEVSSYCTTLRKCEDTGNRPRKH